LAYDSAALIAKQGFQGIGLVPKVLVQVMRAVAELRSRNQVPYQLDEGTEIVMLRANARVQIVASAVQYCEIEIEPGVRDAGGNARPARRKLQLLALKDLYVV
jgi:hypothetical protein